MAALVQIVVVASLLLALAVWATPAGAQPRAQLRAESGPYYAGVAVRLQVVAEGFEESPQPEIEIADPTQGRLTLIGISPSVSTSIQIINGQMSQSKQVQFAFEYSYTPEHTGTLELGPFRVTQDGRRASTGRLRLAVEAVPVDSDHRLRLLLPAAPLIVGQRVPLRLEWWAPLAARGKLVNARLSVPIFDQPDVFRFRDREVAHADVALRVDTNQGALELPATTRVETRDGEKYLVRTIEREMTPLKSGDLVIAPATLVVDEAVRWRRSLFGDRIPTHVRKIRVEDEARTLSVRELPTQGRPESFTGTVGRGYRLEVAADRSVVQVGDPIQLTLTLSGDAAVESAMLPALSADGGMSPKDFRLPAERPAGVFEDGVKRFEVQVRVLHDAVDAIPALAFSWYDPEQRAYETTRSAPIALSVHSAQVVSAGDVVSAAPRPAPEDNTATGSSDEPEADAAMPELGGSSARTFSLSGADLAIETDPGRLLRGDGWLPTSPMAQIAAYLLGLLAVGLAVLARRRAASDPAELALINTLRGERLNIANAKTVTDASAALRRMIAASGASTSPELDAFLATCDDRAYAPGGATRPIEEAMRAEALVLADKLSEETR